MSARLLSGKEPAEQLLKNLEKQARALQPHLVILQVGDNPESAAYIHAKVRACEKIGITCEHRMLPPTISRDDLIDDIHALNADARVTGYILQLPLPDALWKEFPLVARAMEPGKDVDGFTAYNLGKMFLSRDFEDLPPATPAGIITLLAHYDIDIAGKHAVIVGRSNLVGKPLSIMLLNRSATVTVCHSETADLASHTRQADLLISAVGNPGLITAAMVKPGAVVVDIGITRSDGKLVGDVDFESVKNIASAITPVPGGVGPMTVASLLRNVVRAKERQKLTSSSPPPSPSSASRR